MNHQHDASTAGAATPANEKALEAATNSDKGLGKIDSGNSNFKGANLAEQGVTAEPVPRTRKRKAEAISPSEIKAITSHLCNVAGVTVRDSFTDRLSEAEILVNAASALRKMASQLLGDQLEQKTAVEAEAAKLEEKAASINSAAWVECLRSIVESGGEPIRYFASDRGQP